jgi:hypothetical protein
MVLNFGAVKSRWQRDTFVLFSNGKEFFRFNPINWIEDNG